MHSTFQLSFHILKQERLGKAVGNFVLFLIFYFWSFRHCLSDWAFRVSKWVIVSNYIVVLVFYSSCHTGASSATMSHICLLGEWVVLTNTKTIKLHKTEINSTLEKKDNSKSTAKYNATLC